MEATRFSWEVYRGDPHWVPPLLMERERFFSKKNPYWAGAEIAFWMAEREGRPVGTIAAIDEKISPVGHFGFFEFLDDPEAAAALLEQAASWLAARGRARMQGPHQCNTNHECGLLVEGFGMPVISTTYNPERYERTYAALGLEKAQDLLGWWFDPTPVPAQIRAIAERVRQRNPQIRFRPLDMGNWGREVDAALSIYNDAWADNWGFLRISEEEFRFVAEGLKEVLDPSLARVAELDGEPIAFALVLPDLNPTVRKMDGRIFPFGWWHWLNRKPDVLRVYALGVRRKWQKLPIGAPLYVDIWEEALKRGIRGAEASWILESNTRMNGALEKLGARIYRKWRLYERDTAPGGGRGL